MYNMSLLCRNRGHILFYSAGHLFLFEVLYVISFSDYSTNLWKWRDQVTGYLLLKVCGLTILQSAMQMQKYVT